MGKLGSGSIVDFEYCNESDGYASIHVHFDCPVCEEKDVGTDYLSEYYPNDEFYEGDTFYCQKCRSHFETISNGRILILKANERRRT